MTTTARSSISDDEFYVESVRAALQDAGAFLSFRRLAGIKQTIECVKPSQGETYRTIAIEQNPDVLRHLEKFKTSETVGDPVMEAYPEGDMSPTTWRYVKVLTDLQGLFGSLDGWSIAEIGVGFGGQCKILNDVYDIASYTMFDLEPVCRLAQKYLYHVNPSAAQKATMGDFRTLGHDETRTYDLVISNYALSECTRDIQSRYLEHVLRRSTRGYITYNQISPMFGIDSYSTAELVELLGFPVAVAHETLSNPEIPDAWKSFVLHWSDQPLPRIPA